MKVLIYLCLLALLLVGCSHNDNGINFEYNSQADEMNLDNLKKSGVDFDRQHLVDFQISVDTEKNGKKINGIMTNKSYSCTLYKDDLGDRWTSECSKEIRLELETIMNIQEEINQVAKPYNGYSDGWGMMVSPKD